MRFCFNPSFHHVTFILPPQHLASVTYVSSMRDYVSHYVSELDAHVSVGQSVVLSINQASETFSIVLIFVYI